MHRKFVALCAAVCAVSVNWAAAAQTGSNASTIGAASYDPAGPYVGIAGGGSFLNDISPNGGGADTKSQFGNGFVGLGTLGYDFGDGLSAEIEGGYRRSDVRGVRGEFPNGPTGALGMYTYMVNGLYEFDASRFGMESFGLVPHLGVGIGAAQARFDHAGFFNGNTLSGQDYVFAYQGIAGVDYQLAPQVKLALDYRYLGTESGTFLSTGPLGSAPTRTSIADQAVTIGLKFALYEPPPAPVAEAPAPAAAPPVSAPPPAQAPEPQRAFQVFFDFNKSDLTAAARNVIRSAAETAQSGHVVQLVVTGHTDTVGSARYNQKLSERRADAVKTELVNDGVPDAEIETRGVGKNGLLVPTADGVREAQNRRATIELGETAGS
jgi:outer membrane protein OmpA-like peptidoglycan-associated protein